MTASPPPPSMRAIVNTGPGRMEWLTRTRPVPGPGQIRIKTLACGVCATDLEMIAGWTRTGFPSIPGHEWCGRVEAAGPGVDPALIGVKCVAENVLADGGEVGFEHPGGYGAALITEAARVRPLPEAFDPAAGALIEPLAVCVRGWTRLRIPPPDAALVLGDGPIGLMMLMLLRHAGVANRWLVGGHAHRLAFAAGELGAHTLNYHETAGELGAAIRAAAGNDFSCVIEASGSAMALTAAMNAAAVGGRILVLGDYGEHRADFPWNTLLHRELELIGSNASAGAWDEAVRLAVDAQLPLGRLVTTRLPAAQFEQALALARTPRDQIKIVMQWGDDENR